jgi:polar amino acid transport system permease protein
MVSYDWNFKILLQYKHLLWEGLLVTIQLSVLTAVISIMIGLVASLLAVSKRKLILFPVRCYIEIQRALPIMIELVWIYYCLPIIIGVRISAFTTCVIALSVYMGAFYAEVFRAGIQSIDVGQIEAAKSIGMTKGMTMRRIILPQAFKRVLPPFVSQCILVIKNTTLASMLAVADILYQGQLLSAQIFRPLEILTTIAVLFIVVIMPLTFLVTKWEKATLRT